jgi:hypothetical protein
MNIRSFRGRLRTKNAEQIAQARLPIILNAAHSSLQRNEYEHARAHLKQAQLQSHGIEARPFEDKEMGCRSFIVRDADDDLIQFFAVIQK